MKTNGKLIQAYQELEAAVKTGTVEQKILFFKNKQVIEPVISPFIETQKQLNKTLENYQNSISELYHEYGEDFGKGYPEVPMFEKNEDGSYDKSKPNPRFAEFKEKLNKLNDSNKELLDKHKSETETFNSIMESEVQKAVLDSMKFSVIDPTKHKISDDINIDALLEFGIISIDDFVSNPIKKKNK